MLCASERTSRRVSDSAAPQQINNWSVRVYQQPAETGYELFAYTLQNWLWKLLAKQLLFEFINFAINDIIISIYAIDYYTIPD